MEVAAFHFDVTPPIGHPLLGGLIPPAAAVDSPLQAIGIVLFGDGLPVVLCAVDWCALGNEAHVAWRTALADGAQTTPDRVLLHVVHQHNAPFVCLEAARLAAQFPELPRVVDLGFFERCLATGRRAAASARSAAVPCTDIATSQAKVARVASNRRFVGPEGTVNVWRPSSSRLALHRDLPEGLIDPWLKTVAFFSGTQKVAALHFYATHPISFYGDGRVTSDFVGSARAWRQKDEPSCTHVYFTGCAGDVAAGRYNSGSRWDRRKLAKRIYRAMRESDRHVRRDPIRHTEFRSVGLLPAPRHRPSEETLRGRLPDSTVSDTAVRIFDAFELGWRHRLDEGVPLLLACLRVNDVAILSLPAECFVEYQLRAQAMLPDGFVAVAAYGDGGPWYIPTAAAYSQGGYEVERALCDPQIESSLMSAIHTLLMPAAHR